MSYQKPLTQEQEDHLQKTRIRLWKAALPPSVIGPISVCIGYQWFNIGPVFVIALVCVLSWMYWRISNDYLHALTAMMTMTFERENDRLEDAQVNAQMAVLQAENEELKRQILRLEPLMQEIANNTLNAHASMRETQKSFDGAQAVLIDSLRVFDQTNLQQGQTLSVSSNQQR